MPQTPLELLRQRADALQGRYQLRFADKPRATRDAAEMALLIKEGEALRRDLEGRGGVGVDALVALVDERLAAWREEREAIRQAQEAGEAFAEAALLGTRANFLIARYHRHFAGQDRRTRDRGLLAEVAGQMEALQRRMARLLAREPIEELRRDLEVVTENLGIYRQEEGAVARAQAAGTEAERGSLLATLANRQFELYQRHFAGRSRLTRRPGLLERVLGELERVAGEMAALGAAGFDDPVNRKNQGVVAERIAAYRRELEQIEVARAQATVFRLFDALAGEVNAAIDEYNEHFAGQDRATRELERLALLCDRMGELEEQMTELVARYDLEPQHGPLGLTRDALGMFEAEWRAVRDARLH